MTDTEQRFLRPADPKATIPDPDRRRDLPAEGDFVPYTAHWALMLLRGDVVECEPPRAAEAVPETAAPSSSEDTEATEPNGSAEADPAHDGAETAPPPSA